MEKVLLSELYELPIFPYANEFPFLPEEAERELAQDLEVNGQQHPIVIYNGMILDGRNRIRAFKNTRITEAKVEYFTGSEFEAVELVRSLNVLRRHLSVGQLAHAALAYLPYEEEEARKRQLASLKQNQTAVPPDPAELEKPTIKNRANESRNIVAEKFNLSGQRISEAKNLALNAPDLSEEVRSGSKSLDKATRELKARKEEREKKIQSLEMEALDLYSLFQKGKTSLDDAYVTLLTRQAQKKREAQARSEALFKIQGFAESAELRLQDFNLKIITLNEVGFIDEALQLISNVEGYLAVTKKALHAAKAQLLEEENNVEFII